VTRDSDLGEARHSIGQRAQPSTRLAWTIPMLDYT
jgi:hypothetical protein